MTGAGGELSAFGLSENSTQTGRWSDPIGAKRLAERRSMSPLLRV